MTSARWSPTLGHPIGLAWLPRTRPPTGTPLTIRLRVGTAGARPRVVVSRPFYDPEGARLGGSSMTPSNAHPLPSGGSRLDARSLHRAGPAAVDERDARWPARRSARASEAGLAQSRPLRPARRRGGRSTGRRRAGGRERAAASSRPRGAVDALLRQGRHGASGCPAGLPRGSASTGRRSLACRLPTDEPARGARRPSARRCARPLERRLGARLRARHRRELAALAVLRLVGPRARDSCERACPVDLLGRAVADSRIVQAPLARVHAILVAPGGTALPRLHAARRPRVRGVRLGARCSDARARPRPRARRRRRPGPAGRGIDA